MAAADLTAARLRELLHYDSETGLFTWLSGVHRRPEAGAQTKSGHVAINISGNSFFAHRLAFLYMTGEWPKNHVDHINGRPADNRWMNLRDVTRSVNMQNQRRAQRSNKSSGLLGVSWHAQRNCWLAYISVDGRQRSLGLYKTAELAHAAYVEAKRALHEGCTI
mgnify:CR=1 FL=1